MSGKPILPLAEIGPTFVLGVLAAIGGWLLIDGSGLIVAALLILPVFIYLGHCQYRASKKIRSEQGAEQAIVRKQLEVVSRVRAAEFWDALVTSSFGIGALGAMGVWGYQVTQWLLKGEMPPVTWLSIGGAIPQMEWLGVQKVMNWFANQNVGAICLVAGLFIAGLLLSAQNNAEFNVRKIRKELSELKKRS
jgi:hypothetical protein